MAYINFHRITEGPAPIRPEPPLGPGTAEQCPQPRTGGGGLSGLQPAGRALGDGDTAAGGRGRPLRARLRNRACVSGCERAVSQGTARAAPVVPRGSPRPL